MFRRLSVFLLSLVLVAGTYAATTSVDISQTEYTQVAGPGAVQAWVSTSNPSKYCFNTTQPTASSACHHMVRDINIPLTTMETGVYLWMKADIGPTKATVTTSATATLGGSAAGATASNQATANAYLATLAAKAAVAGNPTNRSSTITAGGTAQQLMAANATRRKYRLQNLDATEILCFCDITSCSASTTAVGSYCLAPVVGTTPGGYYEGESTSAISIVGATTGHKFSASEY